MDFNAWIASIRDVLQEQNGPLKLRNGHWEVDNRTDLWAQFGSRIFDNHLDLIKDCSNTVLSEKDPQFELPAEDRFAANLHGKVLKYSSDIRKGMAETLALLGSHGDKLKNCTQHKPGTITVLTIREIFQNADWKLWGSLNNLLPTLAEASPDEFLRAVENALNQSPCPFDELVAQEGNGITGRNYMTGLLWALESLAWSEDYLARVVLILGELAEHDPGGNWANRPANSLTTILMPWFPQTVASVEKRVNALKAIRSEYPDVAWKTFLKLLPSQHQTSSGSHKPDWRKFIPNDWDNKVEDEEYKEQVKAYAELAVEMAKERHDWLLQLVSNLDNLPAPSFKKFSDYLSSDEIACLPEDIRQPIWETLNAFVNKHRRFADARWALDAETVTTIERITQRLTPTKPQNLYHRLFANNDYELYEEKGDWSEQQRKLEERRQGAIQAILKNEGIDAVIQFAETVENLFRIGLSLGYIANKEIDDHLLPQFLDKKDEKYQKLIDGYISGRFSKVGIEWADKLDRANWTANQTCQYLLYLPFESDIWTRAEKWLGDLEKNYWEKIIVNPFPTQSDLLPAIDKLLSASRPRFAIECVYAHNFTKKIFYRDRAIAALIDGVSSAELVSTMDSYHITEVIKMLQDDSGINQDDLFKIEWVYLPLLNRHNGAEPKLLEKYLSTRPEFFCEVIQVLYRSRKEERKETEPSEHKKSLAHNAWQLLHDWKRPPGLLDDGSYSKDELVSWLKEVKKICIESGHIEVAMIHVGHVLFYAPAETDVLWIHRAVAKVLNEKDAEDIRNGFSTEAHNSRGAYWVDPSGKPERELAEQWRQKATAVENESYVRFATTLREIAQSYDREAERIIADHKKEETNEPEADGEKND